MHPELIARAISGIMSPNTNVNEFIVNSMIFNKSVAKNVLHYLSLKGIGSISRDVITFSRSDRLKTAIIALQIGCDIERVSKAVTWKDFEALTLEMLHTFGYATEMNLRFTKPRCEIDVIGIDSARALVIDCKHWKRSNISLISTYVKKQLIRTELFLERRRKSITFAIPIVLTLHSEKVHFINKVPIIPINEFASFLRDFEWNYQEIHVMYAGKK
ncbi:MAG: hypothetical protein ACJ718_02150 [Nitrososphaeraceae archaeon]